MIRVFFTLLYLYQVLECPIPVKSSELEYHRQMRKRIIGGAPIEIYMQPWLVSIQTNKSHICGGSILTRTTILTAAHCVSMYWMNSLSILAGSSRVDEGGSRHRVVQRKFHKKYEHESFHGVNDVALLKVSPPLRFDRNVSKVRLARKYHVIRPGTVATVAGWGYTSENGRLSMTLRRTSLTIVDTKECANNYEDSTGKWVNSHQQICAAAPGKDTCTGDSGGPLIVNGIQFGVTSWSWGCAKPEYPGVYANAAAYHDWIAGHTPNSCV